MDDIENTNKLRDYTKCVKYIESQLYDSGIKTNCYKPKQILDECARMFDEDIINCAVAMMVNSCGYWDERVDKINHEWSEGITSEKYFTRIHHCAVNSLADVCRNRKEE